MLNKVTLLEQAHRWGQESRWYANTIELLGIEDIFPPTDEDVLFAYNPDILALAETDAEIAELEAAVLDSWKAGYSADD